MVAEMEYKDTDAVNVAIVFREKEGWVFHERKYGICMCMENKLMIK